MNYRYWALPLTVMVFNTGCATHYLWTESYASSFREPAPVAQLHVFEAPREGDLLAVYSEINEHNDRVARRAYLVMANSSRVANSRRPFFVDPNSSSTLQPVPLRISTQGVTNYVPERLIGADEAGWVAVSTADQHRFSLFENGAYRGTYDLPVYEDGTKPLRRALFTPFTLVLDITVIGGPLYLYAGAPGLVHY